jgi:riboflavin kinase/FMN adenylyltransferase
MRCLDLEKNAGCRFAADAAVALGNFDGVHIGHRRLFDALGDEFPRAVFTFSDLRKSGLICTLEDRLSLIRDCGVRYAAVADFADVKQIPAPRFVEFLCSSLGARRLVCGYNFTFGAGGAGTADDLRRLAAGYGTKTVIVPPVLSNGDVVSSSRIRSLLELGDMKQAAELLGKNYGITLPVVHGRELGRKMGYPTVNQLIPVILAAPRFGVYASRCSFRGETYESVTNIGVRPTVDGETLCAETHIFDFDEDLYGENVRVELCGFIRPEKRFLSVDELFSQVARDAADARRYFSECR